MAGGKGYSSCWPGVRMGNMGIGICHFSLPGLFLSVWPLVLCVVLFIFVIMIAGLIYSQSINE